MFWLSFDTINAAFEDGDGGGSEIARILREIAESVEAGNKNGTARDVNGNNVGTWRIDASPYADT